MRKTLVLILALILISLVVITGCASGGSEGPKTGSRAPDFKLMSLDGQTVSLSGFKGKPVLLNFWATTCPSCRIEMPYLQTAYEEWTSKVVFLIVNIGEDPATVTEFLNKYSLTLPVLLDRTYEVAGKYNIEFIPATYF